MGRETVISLVMDHGTNVLAVARDKDALDQLAIACENGPGRIAVREEDLALPGASARIRQVIGADRVIALIHNAGQLHHRPMGRHEREELAHLYAVNVLAPLELSQALADPLRGSPPGHIVHIGSMGGFQDSAKFRGLVAYSASKAALACMAQCLAEEFKDMDIRSNCLALGAVDTAMLRAAFPGYQAPVSAKAMGRYIADFALNGHKLFNGKVLPVAVTTP
ncbi:MAG: SDR family oxidoreductase [Flavobacteriales bacterium]|nr:SDR family oxidoreductase [Flavobacteriales bacterium]